MTLRKVRKYIPLIIFAAVFVPHACNNGEGDGKLPNGVVLTSDSVACDNTGQFMAITSSSDWTVTFSVPEGTEQWCSASPDRGSGSRHNVMLLYAANTAEESRKTEIIVDFSDGERIVRPFIQGPASKQDTTGTGGGGGTGGGDTLVSDDVNHWMELPAIGKDGDCMYVAHHASLNGRNVRNYSMYYDTENRIALWVAYPLCHDYMGSGRTDDWDFDPKVPKEYQPVLFGGWPEPGPNGRFDRGHQIPSGSRNSSEALNRQTFYFTNMTAQVSSFNQGVWASLEERVRGYASTCDTLYVVTGPVISTVSDPDIDYTEDNSGNRVAVPKHYFKVLLRRNISSDSWYSIGFWYDNEPYGRKQPQSSDLMSVSDIEELTGITFFTNLPEGVAASVKSQMDPGRWGF